MKQDLAPASIHIRHVVLIVAWGVLSSATVATQTAAPLFKVPIFSTGGGLTSAIAVEDFNGDGRQDLAVTNEDNSTVGILLSGGNGSFALDATVPVSEFPHTITVGDFNGDGRTDLATAGGQFGSTRVDVLLGQLDGSFEVVAPPVVIVGGLARRIAAGNFDADDDQDLVVSSFPGQVDVLLGLGNGSFSGGGSLSIGSELTDMAVGDVNGDGWPDLATSHGFTHIVNILLGQGDGTFASTGGLSVGNNLEGVAVGDLDEDGNQDLAVGDSSGGTAILLGHGNGTFTYSTSLGTFQMTHPRSLLIRDFNIDGHADLAVTDAGSHVVVFKGFGAGVFGFGIAMSFPGAPFFLAAGQFNADGRPDLAVVSQFGDFVGLLLGREYRSFESNATYGNSFGVSIPSSIATADVNGDTRTDLLITARSGGGGLGTGGLLVMLGAAGGTFGEGPFTSLLDPQSIAVGFFDGDDELDVAAAPGAGGISILLGQGGGNFAVTARTLPGEAPNAVAAGDFNGDDKQDLVVTRYGAHAVETLLGSGAGDFSSVGAVDVVEGPVAVIVADFNSDMQLDVATANSGFGAKSVSVRLGQGDGSFSGVGTIPIDHDPRSIAVGDLNDDGHPDLVTGNQAKSVSILLGHGDGSFASSVDIATPWEPRSVVVGDFNADGWQDLGVGMGFVGVLLGDGLGGFSINGVFGAVGGLLTVASDFNQDGDLDLAGAGGVSSVGVLLNRRSSTSFPWTNQGFPLVGIAGEALLVGKGKLTPGSIGDLTLSDAAPSAPAVLYASLTSSPAPFKGGTLIPVPVGATVLIPTSASGGASIHWSNWPPALAGQQLYVQAAIQDGAAIEGVALSNALRADVP